MFQAGPTVLKAKTLAVSTTRAEKGFTHMKTSLIFPVV